MEGLSLINFGISTACFYPIILEEAIEKLGKKQIKNIEIFFNTFSEVKIEYIKELKKRIDFYGQNVLSCHPFTCGFEPFMLFTNYQRRFDDAIELHKYYFEAMNILGAKIFVFHGDRKLSTMEDKAYFERFAVLRDKGKEFGITVAQENVERCRSSDLNFLVSMVKYLDEDVSLVFDNKQAIRSGIDYKEFINKLIKNIIHVHMSDNNEECDCLPLGKGNLNIKSFIDDLMTIKKDINIIIELYRDKYKDENDIYNSLNLINRLYTK